jgi:hypothetical protein
MFVEAGLRGLICECGSINGTLSRAWNMVCVKVIRKLESNKQNAKVQKKAPGKPRGYPARIVLSRDNSTQDA